MTQRMIGYYRPFPWNRIGSERTGRTNVERALRAYCRNQGQTLSTFIVETDSQIKKSLEDRVAGRDAMALLRRNEADGIVVLQMEHIFGSANDALSSLERWFEQNIVLQCIDFLADTPLCMGPNVSFLDSVALVKGLAALQRRIDLENTRQRVTNRKLRGRWTGRVPFGFHLVDGALVEEEDRIARIQQMKAAHRTGKSYRQISIAHAVSVGTAHQLVRTDLRKLRRLGDSQLQIWDTDKKEAQLVDASRESNE